MNIIYLLVIATILISMSFLALFIYATKSGQWDNMDIESKKILLNDQIYKGHENE